MIPKDSTPIKNKILIEIFAKRLLTLDEIAIVSYIMRWSWGFDKGERRQDWTKKLTKRKMADDIEMDRGKCCKILNKMIKEKKVKVKDKLYQFNEHYEEWQKLTKGQLLYKEKVDERSIKNGRKVNFKLTKGQLKVDEKVSLGMPKNQGEGIKNKDVRGGEHTSKETLKETNTKETLKDKGTNFIKAWKDFKTMRKKIRKPMTKRAEELILKDLDNLSNNEEEQIAILNQSIKYSWLGVFPLKGDYNGKNKQYNRQNETDRERQQRYEQYRKLEET
ncbi:hypothetical protein ES708_29051 [subsurface metagenome]